MTVTGPKGTLVRELPVEMEIKKEDNTIVVTRPNDLKKMKSLHGLTRTLINNMVIGVTEGYQKVLEVNGVGYRAAKAGKKLTLSLGYSLSLIHIYSTVTQVPTVRLPIRARYSKERKCRDTWEARRSQFRILK